MPSDMLTCRLGGICQDPLWFRAMEVPAVSKATFKLDQETAADLRLVKAEMGREAGHPIYLPDVVRALIDAWKQGRAA